jgi:hypothetical protein
VPIGESYRKVECPCPGCGEFQDGCTAIQPGCPPPEPGNISICWKCAEICIFTEIQTLRKVTKEEWDSFSDEERSFLIKLQKSIQKG